MNDTHSEGDRAETIRRGMLWASGDHEKKALAKAIHCPRTRFSSFLSRKGDLSQKQMDSAEEWLRSNNYWLVVSATDPISQDIYGAVADELEALSSVLRAKEFPEDYKAGRLASWVINAHRDLGIAKDGKEN